MIVDGIAAAGPWAGVLTGPVVFFVNLRLSLSLLPVVCASGQYGLIHVTAAASLLLTLMSAWWAWRTWRVSVFVRDRFMGYVGVWISGFFVLAIVSVWAPALLGGACR